LQADLTTTLDEQEQALKLTNQLSKKSTSQNIIAVKGESLSIQPTEEDQLVTSPRVVIANNISGEQAIRKKSRKKMKVSVTATSNPQKTIADKAKHASSTQVIHSHQKNSRSI